MSKKRMSNAEIVARVLDEQFATMVTKVVDLHRKGRTMKWAKGRVERMNRWLYKVGWFVVNLEGEYPTCTCQHGLWGGIGCAHWLRAKKAELAEATGASYTFRKAVAETVDAALDAVAYETHKARGSMLAVATLPGKAGVEVIVAFPTN